MRVRGKVLREPDSGPGLLMIEGRQFRFSREAVWQSAVAPKPGLAVTVELDRDLQVVGITAIPEAQLAEEQPRAPGPRVGSETVRGMFSRLIARILARLTGTL